MLRAVIEYLEKLLFLGLFFRSICKRLGINTNLHMAWHWKLVKYLDDALKHAAGLQMFFHWKEEIEKFVKMRSCGPQKHLPAPEAEEWLWSL